MKAVIYKRVSVVNKSVDGTSLEVQQERLEAYAKAHGWEVIYSYQDAGISAKDTNRPALQQMLKDAENKRFDVVLVYKLDRLSRSVSDFHRMSSFLDMHKVALVSVSQHLDTTSPTGRLLRNILVDFANFERELITERVVDNKNHRAAEGKLNGGTVPYGYTLVNKRAVIVQDEAIKAKEVYTLYLTGRASMRKVALQTGLSFSQVEMILMNPFYAGKTAYNKTKYKNQRGMFERRPQEEWIIADGEHKAIITFEEWEKAQRIKKEKRNVPDERNPIQLFKNLCYCGKCGSKLYFYSGSKDYNYYRCHDGNKFEGCKSTSVRHDELEEKVVMKINWILKSKTYWKRASEKKVHIKLENENDRKIKDIDRDIQKLDQQIVRLVEQLADGSVAHLIKPKLLELESTRSALRDNRRALEVIEEPTPQITATIMNDVISRWKHMTYDEKTEGIYILIEKLTVYDDMVTVEWTDKDLPNVDLLLDIRARNGVIIQSRS